MDHCYSMHLTRSTVVLWVQWCTQALWQFAKIYIYSQSNKNGACAGYKNSMCTAKNKAISVSINRSMSISQDTTSTNTQYSRIPVIRTRRVRKSFRYLKFSDNWNMEINAAHGSRVWSRLIRVQLIGQNHLTVQITGVRITGILLYMEPLPPISHPLVYMQIIHYFYKYVWQ